MCGEQCSVWGTVYILWGAVYVCGEQCVLMQGRDDLGLRALYPYQGTRSGQLVVGVLGRGWSTVGIQCWGYVTTKIGFRIIWGYLFADA